ncbi:MAG: hypothetical protein E4H02_10085 [Lentisphaerales bacterium]|jgi:hypothetical protein|nr:MAG: hypothetical protein E4H02_10085 [Lentisphaerales bacterium]
MFRLRQFRTLVGLTTIEIVRQPICLLLSATCVLLMALASLQAFHFGEDGKLARDSALAIQLVFGLLLAAYASCTTLSREMQSGTALAVLSKPVSRDMFFLAKFFGVCLIILLFSALATPSVLLSEKGAQKLYVNDPVAIGILLCTPPLSLAIAAVINFKTRRPFVSTAFWLMLVSVLLGLAVVVIRYDPSSSLRFFGSGAMLRAQTAIQWRLIPASLLVTFALIVIAAIALSLATRLPTAPVIVLSAAVLMGGLLSDYLFGRAASDSLLAAIAYRLIPNWQHFWQIDMLTNGGRISWNYVGLAASYASLYTGATLGAGMLLFRHSEVK